MHRLREGRLRFFEHNPSGPALVRAVVDHVVITGSALGFVGDTALLMATAYDASGVVIPGISAVWSSDRPDFVSVVAGLCFFVAPGTATITATVDGRAYTTSVLSAAPLALTSDANLLNQIERSAPLVAPSSGRIDGFTDTTIVKSGSSLFSNVRTTYPRDDSTWACTTFQEGCGDSTNPPQIHLATQTLGPAGPVDGSFTFDVTFLGSFLSSAYAGYGITVAQPAADNQDVADFIRGGYLGLRSQGNGAGLGAQVYVVFADITTDPSNPVLYGAPTLYTLTAAMTPVGLNLDAAAHLTNLSIIVRPAFDQPNPATNVNVLANSLPIARIPAQAGEYYRLNAFHNTRGLLSQFQHQNSLPEASITLSSGASKVASATDAPDAANYYSGHKLDTYTIPNGEYVTASGLLGVVQANAVGTEAPTAIWLHVYAPSLASGSLQGYATDGNPTVHGPVTMTKDDVGGIHRCRIPVNVFGEGEKQFIPKFQNSSGATLVFGATRFAMTCEEDRNQGRHNAIIPCRAQSVRSSNEAAFSIIKDLSSLVTRAEGIFGNRYEMTEDVDVMATWPGDSPELWQSGPFGSDDYNFASGIRNSPTYPGHAEVYVTMNRGAGFESYASWGGAIIIAPGQIKKLKQFDWFVVWKANAIVAVLLGTGAGTDLTVITNGMTYNGFPVSFSSFNGTPYELSDAGTVASGARHIGEGGDRDSTREHGGYEQDYITSKTVNLATYRNSLLAQIAGRYGARAA